MASPTSRRAMLARGISEIDLNRALEEVKIQVDTGMRYTNANMMTYRENAVINSPIPEGIITPTNRTLPNAPPPTPATPSAGGTPDSNTPKVNGVKPTNEVVDNVLKKLPNGEPSKKKKKKKKSGRGGNKATGFEGLYCCGL